MKPSYIFKKRKFSYILGWNFATPNSKNKKKEKHTEKILCIFRKKHIPQIL